MIDSLLSLSFSIHSNPGVFALLLGSGISREAQIPTGWEVTKDLIRQIAHLNDEECESNPIKWFKEKYDTDPDYSKLLEELADTPTERNQLLRSYFEPSEEEREEGIKTPTEAHRSIAELVSQGYVKVIITTNFDRLTEQAIEEKGITPTIISTPDAAEGAMPLVHSDCTIIKVHGDYLDTRIKNTPQELSEYDNRIDRILDQVFDEYGLIICGWSAEWDGALRSALERNKSQRFSTYWTAYQGEINDSTKKLVQLKKAKVISIEGADNFFKKIEEKVTALKEYDKPHPLSTKMAVTTLKKYLSEERHRIRLHDLIHEEAERVFANLKNSKYSVNDPYSDEALVERMEFYNSQIETLQALFIHGCYWSKPAQFEIWIDSLNRIANFHNDGGKKVWIGLTLYPALILLYSGCMAAISADNYTLMYKLLAEVQIRELNREYAAVDKLYTWEILEENVQKKLPGRGREFTPLSNYLYEVIRDKIKEILPDDKAYELAFDEFEYLRFLFYIDSNMEEPNDDLNYVWGPLGRFSWKYYKVGIGRKNKLLKNIGHVVEPKGDEWTLSNTGAFEGSKERLQKAKKMRENFLKEVRWR